MVHLASLGPEVFQILEYLLRYDEITWVWVPSLNMKRICFYIYSKIILHSICGLHSFDVRSEVFHVWQQHHAGPQKDSGTFGFLDWGCSASTMWRVSNSRAVSMPLLLYCDLCVVWCVILSAASRQWSWEQLFRSQADSAVLASLPGARWSPQNSC